MHEIEDMPASEFRRWQNYNKYFPIMRDDARAAVNTAQIVQALSGGDAAKLIKQLMPWPAAADVRDPEEDGW